MKKIADICEESELKLHEIAIFFLSYMPYFLYLEFNNQWTNDMD